MNKFPVVSLKDSLIEKHSLDQSLGSTFRPVFDALLEPEKEITNHAA